LQSVIACKSLSGLGADPNRAADLPSWHPGCFIKSQSCGSPARAADRHDRAIAAAPQRRDMPMLWTILVVLLVLWAIGLVAHVGGALIHLLLVIAAVVFLVQLLTGRRTVV
jgi:hypothetical protein